MQGRKRKVVQKYSYYQQDIILRNKIQQVHAVHRQTQQEFTLCRISLTKSDPLLYSCVQQQLTTLKWLNHPYIVKCHRIFKTPQHLYLVYDNLPGYPLSDLLHSGCPFQRVLEIVSGLLSALTYLQQRDIIHSQLNPSTILLFGQSKIKLINFGFSIQLIRDPMNLPEFHKVRQTTKFTPPQTQYKIVTATTDVYSLGALIEQMLKVVANPNEQQKSQMQQIKQFAGGLCDQKPSERPSLQKAINYFKNKTFCKKIITIPSQSDGKSKISRQESLNKLKSRHENNNQLCTYTVDCNRQARKLLSKRNFQKFMLQVALLCGRLPLAGDRCLSLGIVLTKKSTILSAQLLKVVQTGSGDKLKIQQKTFNRIHKHKLFLQLQSMLKKQMNQLIQLFNLLSKTVKTKLNPQKYPQIFKELTTQNINNTFLKKCIINFLTDAIDWLRQQSVKPQKRDLILICVLIFLLDQHSIDEGFHFFCGESGFDLWQQPLLVQLQAMSDYNLQKLVILQGQNKKLTQQTLENGGTSSRIKPQKT